MTTPDRNRKLAALNQFLQGNDKPLQDLKPKLTLDLDKLSLDELEELSRLQTYLPESEKSQWNLQRLETHFGRKLALIPPPAPYHV